MVDVSLNVGRDGAGDLHLDELAVFNLRRRHMEDQGILLPDEVFLEMKSG